MVVEVRSEHRCFGGTQGFYRHLSRETGTVMNFSVFQPPLRREGRAPVLYFLAGLTCTEETFAVKAGMQRVAAEMGLMLVSPDTSPRGLGYAGESDHWDFGVGAGFYVDATEAPWSNGYRMGSYIGIELPEVVETHFPAIPGRRGIFGHSMGGHGALVAALRHPHLWHSLSALAPITNPMNVLWGQNAFTRYLGPDRKSWRDWDACELMRSRPYPRSILIDQGLADQFLENQLKPENLEASAKASGQTLLLRRHAGYDHGYYFIQTFVADHLRHHQVFLAP